MIRNEFQNQSHNVINRRNILAIISLALFNFIFLGIEFLFDDCMATVVSTSKDVVNAQNMILAISVLGYLLYPVLSDHISEKLKVVFPIVSFAIILGCVYLIQTKDTYAEIFAGGAISFLILGYFGNAACFLATQVLTDFRILARTVGISYALGVSLQFIHTNWMSGTVAKLGMLLIGSCLFCVILIREKAQTDSELDFLCHEQEESFNISSTFKGGLLLIASVALMTFLFSTLDNAVTLVHANGEFNIGQWPRLILALSGLCAGFLFDIKNRKHMGHMMYMVSILAVICIVVLTLDGPFLVGLLMFYVSAGFFVVYFMSSFMDMSVHSQKPKLWAGLGRGVNNLCAGLLSAAYVEILADRKMAIVIVGLIILGLVSAVIISYEKLLEWEKTSEPSGKIDGVNPDERGISEFAKEFSLTEREEELLRIFLQTEDNVQDVASRMAISRAALYRHIQALNEKTGTKTRVGIVQFYYKWTLNDK